MVIMETISLFERSAHEPAGQVLRKPAAESSKKGSTVRAANGDFGMGIAPTRTMFNAAVMLSRVAEGSPVSGRVGAGVGVGVAGVGNGVGVLVGVEVDVLVGVDVGVAVELPVEVGVGVLVLVEVGVGVGVLVAVEVGVGVGVGVLVAVEVGVGVGVGVDVLLGAGVGVEVGVGVGGRTEYGGRTMFCWPTPYAQAQAHMPPPHGRVAHPSLVLFSNTICV